MITRPPIFFFFFFNDTATTEIYTLSLHDALPIFETVSQGQLSESVRKLSDEINWDYAVIEDRKSTRLNSSHQIISYAVFCLKKKKTTEKTRKSRKFTDESHNRRQNTSA